MLFLPFERSLRESFRVWIISVTICLFFVIVPNLLRPSGYLFEYEDLIPLGPKTQSIPKGKVRVTYFGTSSLLFDDGDTQILIDGFVSRPSLLQTAFSQVGSDSKKVTTIRKQFGMERLKAIFVCHTHYDHVLDAPNFSKQTGAILYGSKSTRQVGLGYGLKEDKILVFRDYQSFQIGDFLVQVLPSAHTPPFHFFGKTNASDPNRPHLEAPLVPPTKATDFIEGGTYDFLIQKGKHSILVKASTNFKKGVLQGVRADILFLGIAQLSEQSLDFQREFYKETVQSVHPKIVFPIHWDNFFLPLEEDLTPNLQIADDFHTSMRFLLRRASANGIEVLLLKGFGQVDLF